MKTNIKIIITLIIGVTLSTTLSYCLAETLIDSKNVYYKDNSNLVADNVQDAIDGTCVKFDNNLSNLKNEIINEIYPIGSIYISTELSTIEAVQEKLGGEWAVYSEGRTLVGSGTSDKEFKINETGGESTHKLTIEEMPSHTHIQNPHDHSLNAAIYGWENWSEQTIDHYVFNLNTTVWHKSNITQATEKIGFNKIGNSTLTTATNQTTGGSEEHNNLQPYTVVYMYKRIK